MSFDILPMELLQMIFRHCRAKDQRRVAQVCHRWAAAVQQSLERKICLIVSIRAYSHLLNLETRFIGKSILRKSNRQYGALNVEWTGSEPKGNMQLLSKLLDICEERFVTVKRLYLRAPPNATLVQFFENRRSWLKDLVELHVNLEPVSDMAEGTEGIYEMSFPHLRELSWHEYNSEGNMGDWDPLSSSDTDPNINCRAFALNAPELRRLTVGLTRNRLGSHLQNPNARWLPLRTLQLRTYDNLEALTIKGLSSLSQRSLHSSERLLQNLRQLSFVGCNGEAIMQICEKCTNLKELTIVEPTGDMSLQIADVLSFSLEHLTIKCEDSTLELYGNAEFQKLQSISVYGCDLEQVVTFVAPQLSTCDIIGTRLTRLIMPHVDQIHTRKVVLDKHTVKAGFASPNVTELHVLLVPSRDQELFQTYLSNYHNVKRLTIRGNGTRTPKLSFLNCLEHLESFSGYELTMRLIDAEKFAGLKKLTLNECTLMAEPTDEEVSLTALSYVRMYKVAIKGGWEDQFPIRVNERQPPIEIVKVSSRGIRTFSSKIYQAV